MNIGPRYLASAGSTTSAGSTSSARRCGTILIPRGDLDFVVELNDFKPDNAADPYLGLIVDLEDLFGRRIDLVSYRAIKNPYFKKIVDATRVSLYAA
jgi:predicted nucleotidyltransferase